jgi:hypothetical protein
MAAAILLILTGPKKWIIVAFLMGVMPVPLPQSIYALGAHWHVARILVLTCLARIAMTRDLSLSDGLTIIDKMAAWSMVCQATAVIILWNFQSDALINQMGALIDTMGAYFVIRILVRDELARRRACACLAFIVAIFAVSMVIEQVTLRNLFGELGGVRAVPEIREGKIRSQGAFRHSILAGTFAATTIPLFCTFVLNRNTRLMGMIGITGATVMTIASNSSTPLLAYVAGVVAIGVWPLRGSMRSFRLILTLLLLSLHAVMKAPVWMLIARVDLTGGSSGYHRAMLVDQFIAHFKDWWAFGVQDTSSWGWDLWDTQNQFVNIGQGGGLLALGLFVAMICHCYSALGRGRLKVAGDRLLEWQYWLLGCGLTAHVVGFFGVNYFDQSRMGWYLLIVIISGYCSETMRVPLAKNSSGRGPVSWGSPGGRLAEPLTAVQSSLGRTWWPGL